MTKKEALEQLRECWDDYSSHYNLMTSEYSKVDELIDDIERLLTDD